jgi:hypothetical protein
MAVRYSMRMIKPTHSPCRWLLALAACVAFSVTSSQAGTAVSAKAPKNPVAPAAVDWKEHTISPVANPIFFEDPIIRSEIRPIFAHHNIDSGFVTGDGDAQLYALQLRYAITDRLAFIAVQDGYFDVHTDNLGDLGGWMDVAAGFKYALIDDTANQFILTPGFTFFIPLGNEEVFQGRGSGEWNVFVSAAKGFDDFHLTTNVGLRFPNDTDEQSTILHYSLMADYYVCQWFIPFVVGNGWTVLADGNGLPIDSEGYDVINFGSSRSSGTTQMTLGGGFRTRITSNVDLGFAYEKAVISPEGLTDDRFTFDVSIRF